MPDKPGQPTKYKPEYCAMVIQHMSEGLSIEAFAGVVGVSKDTIYEWRDKHQEFSDSVKEGAVKSILFWEKVGRNGMLGKIPGFNVTAWIFNMKNRLGWKDRQEIAHTGAEGGPIQYQSLSDEEVKRRIADALEVLGLDQKDFK